MSDNLLCVQNLSIGIKKHNRYLKAVDDISFDIKRGEILGIVGESGCGKSLTALSILGLLSEGISVIGGSILFEERDLVSIRKEEFRRIQGKDISIVFQEPMTSLNPLMKIGKQIEEVVLLHKKTTRQEVKNEVLSILKKVGIREPERCTASYPHQLSGGMRQRVMIAMAVICNPKLLIADEPTTALDVITQAQILALLLEIHKEYNTSILFISHDLGVIKNFCDRALVMYAGKFVEYGTIKNIFLNPLHEYTKGLINSIPTRDCKGKRLSCIKGRVPNLEEHKSGCPFVLRCERSADVCFKENPPTIVLGKNHSVSCHLTATESEKEYARI